jgi:integrase/recombinase XerD
MLNLPQNWAFSGQLHVRFGNSNPQTQNFLRKRTRILSCLRCRMAQTKTNLWLCAHPHRFRDTFAVSLLNAGASLENVSVLLGHTSIRVIQKHYNPC